jgi:phage regulator Rha-like protein
MTSIEIAELTGKQHKDVLKAIRNMEPAWVKTTGRNFALCEKYYPMANGVMKKQPYFSLSKTECLYIATKFNGDARGHRDCDKGKACPCFNANMEYG